MKQTPLLRKTPLKPKRERPRREAPERVVYQRMKPKAGQPPNAEQERYHNSLRFFDTGRSRPCQCGCGRIGEHIHHILARVPGKAGRRDHWFVVLLSHSCHNGRHDSVHGLGSEARFLELHGADLPAIAVDNLERWRASNG